LIFVTKVTDMLLNFPRRLSILLLQTSKSDNNALALDIDAIYNLKLRKTTKISMASQYGKTT
jgi:hypothetical protein